MRCGQAREYISKQSDGRLGEAGARQLAEHLGGCRDCRSFSAVLGGTQAALRAAGPAHPPPGLARRATLAGFAAKAAEQARPRESSWWADLFRLAWPAAALAGAAATALLVFAAGPAPTGDVELGDPAGLTLTLERDAVTRRTLGGLGVEVD